MSHLESLVVLDASPQSRQVLAFGFERAGYKVYATAQGSDALAMAQTRVPQLVVASTDGGEEALSVVGRLREEATTRELPILVVGERASRDLALRAGADEFVARPAFLRDVVTLAKLAVALRQDGDDSGLVGVLEDYQLYFLTRALAVAGRTAIIELERGARSAELHFVQGELVHARCGQMTGVAAFHHLILWGEAAMHLRFETPTGERKITTPVEELLNGAEGFAREFDSVSGRVGGPHAVYRQVPRRAAEVRAQIPGEVLMFVKSYDGKKPFIDVVEDSQFKPLDTIKITFRLAELGVIERIDKEGAEPLTAQLAVRDWLLGEPEGGDRATVTEAGRRAAEAYAQEAARRAVEKAPTHDLFGEPPASETGKRRKRGRETAPAKPGEHDTVPTPLLSPEGEDFADESKTIPFSKVPFDVAPEVKRLHAARADAARAPDRAAPNAPKIAEPPPPVPVTTPAVKTPAPAAVATPAPKVPSPKTPAATRPATKPVPAAAAAPAAKPVAAPAPKATAPKASAPAAPASRAAPAKPSRPGTPHKLAEPKSQTGAVPKLGGPAFSDVEEEFFASAAELAKVDPIESFEDLEPPVTPRRRSWFAEVRSKFAGAPAKPKSPTKK